MFGQEIEHIGSLESSIAAGPNSPRLEQTLLSPSSNRVRVDVEEIRDFTYRQKFLLNLHLI